MQSSPFNGELADWQQAMKFTHWQPVTEDSLIKPRQDVSFWLSSELYNSSDQALIRWLVIEPWRLKRVEAYFIKPASGDLLRHSHSGLEVALQDREINNGKTLIPVQLNAGEHQRLLLKVNGSSLPFLSIKTWEPVTYTQNISSGRTFQIAMLAGIITLLLVLALQFNARLIITGIWLLVAFFFETEKDGFFSNYLFSSLEHLSGNFRFSAWIFTEQLFITTSVFLLGLNQSRAWRVWLWATAIVALTYVGLTFMMDINHLRSLGILITAILGGSWLLMIRPALRIKHSQQLTLLVLLGIYWLVSNFLLFGYVFNFYYTSAFAVGRIYVEIVVALALIITYSWQQKQQLRLSAQDLETQRARHQQSLELTVNERTQDLNTALESAKKASAAKVNFLGQISHDLRAPLTAILGYAQLQTMGAVDEHKANQIIQDRAGYMKDLIDSLVDYTHDVSAEHDGLRDIYLIAFIDNLANQVHLLANRQANRFQVNIETELPTVIRCNPIQLQRILLNLLDNAAKYTTQGEIILAVSLSQSDSEQQLIFRVSDTGQGIAPEQLENIYTPFFQGADSHSGSGLGLAICFELAARIGSTLTLNSELGVGTHACLTLPYLAGSEHQAQLSLPVAQDLLPIFDAKDQLAWIVEDSLVVSELLDLELTEMGFNTQLALSAEDFINHIKDGDLAPAVIITDYHLPGASGLAVLAAARQHWPNVPVMLISAAQIGTSSPAEAPPLVFNAYLTKPIDLLTLRLELAKLCNL